MQSIILQRKNAAARRLAVARWPRRLAENPFAMLFLGVSTLAQHRRLGATPTFDTSTAAAKEASPTGFKL
jgi:hypothetical protein